MTDLRTIARGVRFGARKLAFTAGAGLTLALSCAAAAAESAGAPAEASSVSAIAARLEQQKDQARLVFEMTAEVAAEAFPVTQPDRIVVDLPEVAFRIDPKIGQPAGPRQTGAGAAGDGLVKSYRFGSFAPGRSRIVIDLAHAAKVTRAESQTNLQNPQLVIELEKTDDVSFAVEAAKRSAAVTRVADQASSSPEPAKAEGDDKPIVVIDPGHGGVDVGAAGAHGEQEKTIVLEFARTLKAKLEAAGRFRVLLTREQDVFLALDDRVRFARRNGAALFLSIHADTLGEPSVEGATVYTVSSRASDAEAAKIAEKENLADQAAGLERKEDAEDVGDILFDLTRRETRAYSRFLAEALVERWKAAGALNKNPTRSAGFVVLKAPDVPSVLLELGYLSSARDLARLTSTEWRERAADTTAQAIDAFFSTRERPDDASSRSVASTARPRENTKSAQ